MNQKIISKRDKIAVIIAIPLFLIWAFYKFVYMNKRDMIPSIKRKIILAQNDITSLENDIKNIKNDIQNTDKLNIEIERLTSKLNRLKNEGNKKDINNLSSILNYITTADKNIKVVEILSDYDKKRPEDTGQQNYYPVSIYINADFPDLLSYLKKLETANLPFNIDNIEITSAVNPTDYNNMSKYSLIPKEDSYECNMTLRMRFFLL